MSPLVFVVSFVCVASVYLVVGAHHLPRERWQVLASIPRRRTDRGWEATNLTFYGVLSAVAGVVATAVFIVLSRSVDIPAAHLVAVTGVVFAVAVPASSLIASKVERKPHTLSIAGAVFPTILSVPLVLTAYNLWLHGSSARIDALGVVSAAFIAYVIGEGLGRVACLSFGCCYGRPIDTVAAPLRPLFDRWHVVFHGATKKIAYAAGLEGVKVVPIQVLTSWVHLIGGGAAMFAFLRGDARTGFLLAAATAFGWRALSEFLRNDHRGAGARLSVYQSMALIGLVYSAILAFTLEGSTGTPDLRSGLSALWRPGAILLLEAVGVVLLLHSGWSRVTGCDLHIHVRHERV